MLGKFIVKGTKTQLLLLLGITIIYIVLSFILSANRLVAYSNNYNSRLEKGDTITYDILDINEPPIPNTWHSLTYNKHYRTFIGSKVLYTYDTTEVWSSSQRFRNTPQPIGDISIGDLSQNDVPSEVLAENLLLYVGNYYFGFITDLDWDQHKTNLEAINCKVRNTEELIHWIWYSTFNIEYCQGNQIAIMKFEQTSGVLLYMRTENIDSGEKFELLISDTTITLAPIIPLFIKTFAIIATYFTIVPIIMHYAFKQNKAMKSFA